MKQLMFAPFRLEQPMEFGGQPSEPAKDWMKGMNTYKDATKRFEALQVTLAGLFLCSTFLEWFNLRKL